MIKTVWVISWRGTGHEQPHLDRRADFPGRKKKPRQDLLYFNRQRAGAGLWKTRTAVCVPGAPIFCAGPATGRQSIGVHAQLRTYRVALAGHHGQDRKSVVEGKSVTGREVLGGRLIIIKQKYKKKT